MGCDAVLKATNVDGVYSAHPKKDPNAKRYDRLTHDEAIERNLKVMDSTAISMCKDNNLPIIVFNLRETGNIRRAVMGEPIGTRVESGR
jgi:uridylate kinase